MSETILKVQHLGKSFGNNEILKDIDFSVKPKDVTCIIGPSGSGKSTLLRCMNLLETPSSGEIRYHGTNIMDKHVNVPHTKCSFLHCRNFLCQESQEAASMALEHNLLHLGSTANKDQFIFIRQLC